VLFLQTSHDRNNYDPARSSAVAIVLSPPPPPIEGNYCLVSTPSVFPEEPFQKCTHHVVATNIELSHNKIYVFIRYYKNIKEYFRYWDAKINICNKYLLIIWLYGISILKWNFENFLENKFITISLFLVSEVRKFLYI